MKLNIIDEIEESVEKRRKKKQEIDSAINLSQPNNVKCNFSSKYSNYSESKPIRLLDEGAILFENGHVRDFIMKGSIERFYDALPDDFVGYINLGHIDNWALPLNLGTWTKNDLTVVDIGDGRKGLDCTAHINKDLYIVKDLLAQEIPLSVSVEMYVDIDWEKTELMEFACIKDINIVGFSIVGNPANVSSSGITLSSEEEDNLNLEKLKKYLVGESEVEELAEEQEETIENTVEDIVDTEENNEENVENTTQETEDSVEETQEEATNDEEASDDETIAQFITKFEELEAKLNGLESEKTELEAKIEELETSNSELKDQLDSKTEKAELSDKRIEDFVVKIEKLMNKTEGSTPRAQKSTWGSLD